LGGGVCGGVVAVGRGNFAGGLLFLLELFSVSFCCRLAAVVGDRDRLFAFSSCISVISLIWIARFCTTCVRASNRSIIDFIVVVVSCEDDPFDLFSAYSTSMFIGCVV
jgi:hypothetical protein